MNSSLHLHVSLEQWFSKCGAWSSSISISWDLLGMQILALLARPTNSETQRVGPNNLL